jgi:hypothetical protein
MQKPIACPSLCEMRYGISSKLLQEVKVWETEANAERGEKATSVGSTGKANSGPAGEAASAEESGPAGKAAGADIEWHNEEGGNIADRLPEIYREWASVFSKEEINRLPDHTEYDHRIELVEGTVPSFGPIYPLSENELQALREYLRKELAAGKIRRTHYNCPETRRKHTALRGLSGSEEKMGITSSASPKGAPRTLCSSWALPRSVENLKQFSSFANLYREVAGTDSAN